MGRLDVEVNGRSHRIGCEDGQEDRVRALARKLNARVKEIAGTVEGVDDERLLLMAALLAEDEARTELEKRLEREHDAAKAFSDAADRLEALSLRLRDENA